MTQVLDQFSGSLLAADDFFVHLDDHPLDEVPIKDGNDSILKKSSGLFLPNPPGVILPDDHVKFSAPRALRRVIVPLKREIKWKMEGRDVLAVQRALIRADVRTRRTTGRCGKPMVNEIETFQDLKNLKVDGVVGSATFHALLPYFDAYGEWLVLHFHPKPKISMEQQARNYIEACCLFGYNHAANIHYTQGWLRMEFIRLGLFPPPKYSHYYDCSSFATWVFRCARVVDPNGLRYNGSGYTGTLSQNGTSIKIADAARSDMYFYGSGTFSHVTIAVGDKGKGYCVSHGSEGGPYFTRFDYRRDTSRVHRYSMKKLAA